MFNYIAGFSLLLAAITVSQGMNAGSPLDAVAFNAFVTFIVAFATITAFAYIYIAFKKLLNTLRS